LTYGTKSHLTALFELGLTAAAACSDALLRLGATLDEAELLLAADRFFSDHLRLEQALLLCEGTESFG
jgi:hypothetical protein